jgi:FAD/FMN-containing dehydrogenase
MLSRRDFLRTASIAALSARCAPYLLRNTSGATLNDIHSQLNETSVARLIAVDSADAVREAVRAARRGRLPVSIAGGRHAMGGQQFGTGTVNLDMRPFHAMRALDADRGIVHVDSGIEWPDLINGLLANQSQWGIRQKQTGADRLTIGGAIAANIHGRGLTMPPFVHDIEEFSLVDANGDVVRCSRDENRELFSLVIGGYGLFGVVTDVALRLARRRKVRRVVEIRSIDGLMDAMEKRIANGFLYGDFQFSIDEKSPHFMRDGVFSCYQPVPDSARVDPASLELTDQQWAQLFALGHFDKARAYDLYTRHYMSTSGQIYWSDTHQLGVYIDNYHRAIDARTGKRGSEMITEIYVPRARLADFMEEARADFLKHRTNVFYGTIRLIERDDESFLRWAREPWACVVFNLHIDHTTEAKAKAADAFRRLIDMAIERNGSYYLTYHRWARRDQVERSYPQMPEFLRLKKQYDPQERFQSDWYRHYRTMFA